MAHFKERINISIVGLTNVGKSTLFNIITGQKGRAIVNSKAGTTADNVIGLIEMHGVGSVKLIDTAGVDEIGLLGDKKREKTYQTILESDLVLFVVNSNESISKYEEDLIKFLKEKNKDVLLVNNIFKENNKNKKNINEFKSINLNLKEEYSKLENNKVLNSQSKIVEFIKNNYKKEEDKTELLPNMDLSNSYVLLVIPLDDESPDGRLLRPQSLVIEKLLRKFATPVLYRPDLKNFNKEEFLENINNLENTKNGLSLIITDSQAISKIQDYIPDSIKWTSFSIIMSNFMSGGKITELINNTHKIEELQDGDKILIVEACKHDKKCDDIATIQLPNAIKKYTKKEINFDFNFGQTFLTKEELKKNNYKMVVICGGCMIDKQKYQSRIEMIKELNIPISNFGLVFSYIKNKNILDEIY